MHHDACIIIVHSSCLVTVRLAIDGLRYTHRKRAMPYDNSVTIIMSTRLRDAPLPHVATSLAPCQLGRTGAQACRLVITSTLPPPLHGQAREAAVGIPHPQSNDTKKTPHIPGPRVLHRVQRPRPSRLRPPMRFAPPTWESPPPSDLPLPVLCASERMPVADPSSYTALYR